MFHLPAGVFLDELAAEGENSRLAKQKCSVPVENVIPRVEENVTLFLWKIFRITNFQV